MRLRTVIGRLGGLALLAAALVILPGLAVDARAAHSSDDDTPRPVDLIRASVARMQEVIRSTSGRGSETERAELREIAETMFDFAAMSRRILARHWSEGTPEQQREFVRLFTNLLAGTHIDVIVSGVSVGASVDGESVEGSYARVRTRKGGDISPAVSIAIACSDTVSGGRCTTSFTRAPASWRVTEASSARSSEPRHSRGFSRG